MDDFWRAIDVQLDAIEAQKPTTGEAVIRILGRGFFAGSGGDRSLLSALQVAGWRVMWMEASYFYAVRHPVSGDTLSYIEGDVVAGSHEPVGAEAP